LVNWLRFRIEKKITLEDSIIKISYSLTNSGDKPNFFRFGPEFNFAMLGGNSPDRYYLADGQRLKESALNSRGSLKGIKALTVVNEWDRFKLTVSSEKVKEFWYFPVETVSLSEAGFERVYQSSVVVPLFEVNLQPGEKVEIPLNLRVDYL